MAEVDWAPSPGRLAAGVTLVCSFLTLSCQGKKFSSPDHVGGLPWRDHVQGPVGLAPKDSSDPIKKFASR